MYKIDSCLEKLRQKNNVCNRHSYHTVCKNPIVDRRLLTHSDYLKMLSTPKGYKWQGMALYYNLDTKRLNNTHQQKMHNRKTGATQKKTDKNLFNEQKEKGFDYGLNADANESKNKLNKKLQKENYASKSNHENENNSAEKLNIIQKERETFDLLMKKKQLWLQSKKKHRREEKEKKLKSALQAKKNALVKHKKEMEEKIKLKIKRKQTLEENRRKQKSEKEKEENIKRQALAEREMYEQRAELRKETEKYLKLEALKLKAEQIIEEEEAWKNKINKAYALKMGNTFNSKHHELFIKNIGDDNAMGKIGKKRLTQYTNNLLNAIKQNDQVFDPGNLMKQIIRKELNKDEKKQVKLKNRLAPFDINKNTFMGKTEDQEEKCNLPKKIMLEKKYESENTAIESKNKISIKFDNSVPNQYKKMSTCKTHNVHRYNTTLFNTVCRWKTEVDRVKNKMQNCQQNLIPKAKDHNMWEQKIFS